MRPTPDRNANRTTAIDKYRQLMMVSYVTRPLRLNIHATLSSNRDSQTTSTRQKN